MKSTDKKPTVEIEVVSGVEGPSIYINSYRVAGNKPWGGGTCIHKWKADVEDIKKALEEMSQS